MTRLPIILLAAASLVACGQREPHWENRCVETETRMQVMPTTICGGQGGCRTTFHVQPVIHCVQRQMQCVIQEDGQQCPPLDQTEDTSR